MTTKPMPRWPVADPRLAAALDPAAALSERRIAELSAGRRLPVHSPSHQAGVDPATARSEARVVALTATRRSPAVRAPLALHAAAVQAAGRNGDTILAHISPREAALLKQLGGKGTPNPITGVPEFFDADPGGGSGALDGMGGSQDRAGAGDATGGALSPPASALSGITAASLAPLQRFATQAYNDVLAQPVTDIGNLLRNPDEIPGALASAAPGLAPVVAELPQALAGAMSALRMLGAAPDASRQSNPLGIPEHFIVQRSSKSSGTVYADPAKPAYNRVRVMPGNPNSPNPAQQKPYVVDLRDGQAIDVDGNPLPSPKDPAAHIPQSQYQYRP